MTGDTIDGTRLARLFGAPDTPPAIAATTQLVW